MSGGDIRAIYRLSPVQEGMLYHCLEGASPHAYVHQYGCVYEDLQPEHLRGADGLALSKKGGVYVASNYHNTLLRLDRHSGEAEHQFCHP